MSNISRLVFIVVLFIFLSACGGRAVLIDRDGRESTGTFDSVNKAIEIPVNGKLYKGIYVTNSSIGFGSYQTFGVKPTYGATQTVVSGNTGRAIIRSADGDIIQCEFNFEGMNGIGTCTDAKGNSWQLIAGR